MTKQFIRRRNKMSNIEICDSQVESTPSQESSILHDEACCESTNTALRRQQERGIAATEQSGILPSVRIEEAEHVQSRNNRTEITDAEVRSIAADAVNGRWGETAAAKFVQAFENAGGNLQAGQRELARLRDRINNELAAQRPLTDYRVRLAAVQGRGFLLGLATSNQNAERAFADYIRNGTNNGSIIPLAVEQQRNDA
jgi:hypothetical protein